MSRFVVNMLSPSLSSKLPSIGARNAKQFYNLKKALSQPKVLSRPEQGETFYLFVSSDVVSVVLIKETIEGQKPTYFTSKALQGSEIRYQRI